MKTNNKTRSERRASRKHGAKWSLIWAADFNRAALDRPQLTRGQRADLVRMARGRLPSEAAPRWEWSLSNQENARNAQRLARSSWRRAGYSAGGRSGDSIPSKPRG